MPSPESGSIPLIIITGASSGIGAALATRLARPGRAIAVLGRNAAGVEATAERVRAAGAIALTGCFDLRGGAFGDWLAGVEGAHQIAALYANAGASAGPPSPRAMESEADAQRLIATNLTATIGTVSAVVAAMRRQDERRAGPSGEERRIGIVASIAGIFPTPDLAVYSATKAGLIAYAHAIRPRLAGERISVTVACPGFVTTPMSARHHGLKPFEMDADAGAAAIVRAVERGKRTAIFPRFYAFAAALLPLAPGPLLDAIYARFAADIGEDPSAR